MSTKYGLPETITAQTLFDKVATHLLAQGRPALSSARPVNDAGKPFCAYRGDGDTACAVGCLIPDDRYKPDMEEHTVEDEIIRNVMPELATFESMLYDVQHVHDVSASRDKDGAFVRDSLAGCLIYVAEKHGLSHSAIDAQIGA